MKPSELNIGDIMQISPSAHNKVFAGCLLIVTEPKTFGAQGYVKALGTREEPGGAACVRIAWDDMEPTGGVAQWIIQ
jgi:hypothetical protein